MATLTGAQGVATGRYHGAVLTNKEAWEPACMAAGKASGDLVVSTFCNCQLTTSWRFCWRFVCNNQNLTEWPWCWHENPSCCIVIFHFLLRIRPCILTEICFILVITVSRAIFSRASFLRIFKRVSRYEEFSAGLSSNLLPFFNHLEQRGTHTG